MRKSFFDPHPHAGLQLKVGTVGMGLSNVDWSGNPVWSLRRFPKGGVELVLNARVNKNRCLFGFTSNQSDVSCMGKPVADDVPIAPLSNFKREDMASSTA